MTNQTANWNNWTPLIATANDGKFLACEVRSKNNPDGPDLSIVQGTDGVYLSPAALKEILAYFAKKVE